MDRWTWTDLNGRASTDIEGRIETRTWLGRRPTRLNKLCSVTNTSLARRVELNLVYPTRSENNIVTSLCSRKYSKSLGPTPVAPVRLERPTPGRGPGWGGGPPSRKLGPDGAIAGLDADAVWRPRASRTAMLWLPPRRAARAAVAWPPASPRAPPHRARWA